MSIKKKISGIMLFAMLFSASAAAQAGDNLKFKGNLVIPNCTVNGGNPIEVDFGDIEIQTLQKNNIGYYGRKLDISVNCPYTLGTPKFSISGNMATDGTNGIQTSKYNAEKLVVWLRTSDTNGGRGDAVIINGGFKKLPDSAITISGDGNRTVHLYASVGREGGMELLTPGPFTASANMEVRYE